MKNRAVLRRLTRIITIFALFVIVLWGVFFITVSSANSANMQATLTMAVDNMLAQLGDEFSGMMTVSTMMSGNATIKDFLTESGVQEFYRKAETVAGIISSSAYPQISSDSIITITANGAFYRFSGSVSRQGLDKLVSDAQSGMSMYSVPEIDGTRYFCLAMPVYANQAGGQSLIGYIVILSDVTAIRRTLSEADAIPGIDNSILLNDTVLISSRPELDGKRLSDIEAEYGTVKSSRVQGTSLYAIAAITRDALNYHTRVFAIISAITLLALLITVWLLYRALSASMVVPLLQTADHMKSGLLRTQIDAHFIVNTIDCIEKLIQQHKHDEAEIAAHDLTALITGMHGAGDEIPIDEELEFLLRYIEIMNIRSGDKYAVDVDVDDELSDYMTPARVLQPLVENAMHHGFAGMAKGCELTVSGRLEKQGVAFEVSDNGCGMEAGQVDGLQEMLDTAGEWDEHEYRLKGVALLNIQRRIRAKYGKPYGLFVSGEPSRGLRVIVRLPLIRIRDKEERM